MIIIDVEQGSDEWHKIRTGVPTASNFDRIVTSKGEPSKQQEKYLFELVAERLMGFREQGFQSQAMLRGVELEAEARSFYELQNNVTIQKVGFVFDDLKRYGCSPDGFVGEHGMVEFKCPLPHNHISYIKNGGLDKEYFHQVQGQLLVTGKKWCDLVSYCPSIKPLVIRIYKHETYLFKLEKELDVFCEKIEKLVKELK